MVPHLETWQWALVFVVAAAAVVRAGVSLAAAADELAERSGLGRVLVGALLLALATSLPELLTDASATLAGAPDLAVADLFGASMAIGVGLLAVTTSLPELVASLAAVRMGAHDLAVGNLFGTNAANMSLLVVLDALYTRGRFPVARRPRGDSAYGARACGDRHRHGDPRRAAGA